MTRHLLATDASLDGHLHNLVHNFRATKQNLPREASLFNQIDKTYHRFLELNSRPDPRFPAFFANHAHSVYRSAIIFSMAGKINEAFLCGRLTLEHSAYALVVSKDPNKIYIWLDREESEIERKTVRREFKTANLIDAVSALGAEDLRAFSTLYEAAITYGAHPHPAGILAALSLRDDGDSVRISFPDFVTGNLPHRSCMVQIMQCGILSLRIFQHMYKTKFEITGLSNDLTRILRSLTNLQETYRSK